MSHCNGVKRKGGGEPSREGTKKEMLLPLFVGGEERGHVDKGGKKNEWAILCQKKGPGHGLKEEKHEGVKERVVTCKKGEKNAGEGAGRKKRKRAVVFARRNKKKSGNIYLLAKGESREKEGKRKLMYCIKKGEGDSLAHLKERGETSKKEGEKRSTRCFLSTPREREKEKR